MKLSRASLIIDDYKDDEIARLFCANFLLGIGPRYIFGRNEYAKSVAGEVEIDGFIDDFTDELEFLGKPILRTEDVPQNALVVVVVLGRPFVAERRLKSYGIQFIDYFAFKRYADIDILPVKFWDEFRIDFEVHRDRYDWIYALLKDDESRSAFKKIVNFRLSCDLEYMRGFTDAQYRQYFEDFLVLKPEGEVFVDVGGFDGYTSIEFIKRCPDYDAIHVFEPEAGNMAVVKDMLAEYSRIHFYLNGLSNCSQILRFKTDGSASRITEQGDMEIKVDRLDDILREPFSFLKMDIEGGGDAGYCGREASYH